MNPFTTPEAIVPATGAQLSFLQTLLAERDWANAIVGPNTRARVATINLALDMTAATDGEVLNEYLTRADAAPLTKAGATKLIGSLKELPMAATSKDAEAKAVAAGFPSAELVPAGRYALATTSPDATNGLAFYKVDRPTEGRWAGAVFVKLMKSDDEIRLSKAAAMGIMARISETGAEAASAAYGLEIGECGVCGRTLTNDASREVGIGPKCQAKMGW